MLDSSGSIGSTNYKTAKSFVKDLVSAFTVQSTNRVAFIVFSDDVTTVINITNTLSPSEISSSILAAPYLASVLVITDLAIDEAVSELSSSPRAVPRNLVLITDGESTIPSFTEASANTAINDGIRTFSVGIGNSANQQELLYIANGEADHVFTVNDFDELVTLLDPLSRAICES